MTTPRTLLLLRHAEAEATRPGARDRDRRLTERGRAQATAVGATIRGQGWAVDHVLCSTADRTRETLAGLALTGQPTVELVDGLYDAGSDDILELVESVPATARCLLVVGHAPGTPRVVWELVDAAHAEPAAWATIDHRFPPATLAALVLGESAGARLVFAGLH